MKEQMLDGRTVKKIYLIPYSHHDYAWVCIRNWHISRYIKSFSEVVEMIDNDPEFTWCIDNVIHSWLPFVKNCPELAERFIQHVRNGRIEILDGGYSLARPSYVGEESYIRNITAGRKFFCDTFGTDDIPCLFNADTACGHSQVPQIAKLSGHKYYRFLRSDVLLTKKGVPLQFVWEGLDGSRILVTRGSYGGLWVMNEWMDNDFSLNWDETKKNFVDIWLNDKLIPENPTENVIQFIGSDDCRPLRDAKDKKLRLNEFKEAWNSHEPVKMEYSTLGKVCKELGNTDLPVFKGVLDHSELSYNLPFKGDRSMWKMRLILDRLLVSLERNSLLASMKGMEYPHEKISEMWKDLFEITGHAIEFILKDDYNDLYTIAESVKFRALKEITKARDFIVETIPVGEEIQLAVINELNWEVTGLAECEITSYRGIGGFDLIDSNGELIPYQIIDFHTGYNIPENADYVSVRILFKAKVPPMGYALFQAVRNNTILKSKTETGFIDPLPAAEKKQITGKYVAANDLISVEFNNGKVTGIKKIKDGSELKAAEGDTLTKLSFKKLPPANSWLSDFNTVSVHEFEVSDCYLIQDGHLRTTIKADGMIAGNKAAVEYSLEQGENALGIKVTTDFKDETEGMLTFSIPADAGSDVFADIPFGTEKREFFYDMFYNGEYENAEIANAAPAEWELPGQIYGRNWCSFESSGIPAAIVTKNCSVYYNKDKNSDRMELILNRHMPLKYRTDRWTGQNPEAWNGTGINTFDFYLMLNDKNGRSSDIQRFHKQRAFPLAAKLSHRLPEQGVKPSDDSLIGTDAGNIICTAAYLDGNDMVFRLFECDGKDTDVKIRLPEGVKTVRMTDFNNVETGSAGLMYSDNDKLYADVHFSKFQIITLHVQKNEEDK